MRLNEEILFENCVWFTPLEKIDLDTLITYAYFLKEKMPSYNISNRGGWQSQKLVIGESESLKELFNTIDILVQGICETKSLPKLSLINSWFNLNPKGAYHEIHDHKNSIISGVFYIKVPEDSGNINFYRSDSAEYFLPDNIDSFNSFNSCKYTYEPKESFIFLFPSWLKHSVDLNNSTKDRISLSFNYG